MHFGCENVVRIMCNKRIIQAKQEIPLSQKVQAYLATQILFGMEKFLHIIWE